MNSSRTENRPAQNCNVMSLNSITYDIYKKEFRFLSSNGPSIIHTVPERVARQAKNQGLSVVFSTGFSLSMDEPVRSCLDNAYNHSFNSHQAASQTGHEVGYRAGYQEGFYKGVEFQKINLNEEAFEDMNLQQASLNEEAFSKNPSEFAVSVTEDHRSVANLSEFKVGGRSIFNDS